MEIFKNIQKDMNFPCGNLFIQLSKLIVQLFEILFDQVDDADIFGKKMQRRLRLVINFSFSLDQDIWMIFFKNFFSTKFCTLYLYY